MPDFFLSYTGEDRGAAEKLYQHLSQIWNVWWDDRLVGSISKNVTAEIRNSACLIGLASEAACDSEWVLAEWSQALSRGLKFIPVFLDHCELPCPFNEYSGVHMGGWNGDAQAKGYLHLARKLSAVVEPRREPPRLIEILEGRIRLPCLFQSISSYETRLKPPDALKVVRQAPHVLMSAYDMCNWPEMADDMQDYMESGGFVLLDSGGYEAGRLGDTDWSPEKLWAAWADTPHDLAFCFDNVSSPDPPPDDVEQVIEQVVKSVERDGKEARNGAASILPIVHIPRALEGREYRHELAPDVIFGVATCLQPALIAIPERELGNGIIERAKTMRNIRRRLSKLSFYQPVHILGTGAPWAISVLAAAGADSFDGLEWCRYVVDHDSGMLQHFHDLDFFSYQSWREGETGGLEPHIALAAEALRAKDEDYRVKVALHNLSYYAGFVEDLRGRAETGNFAALLNDFLKKDRRKEIERQMPELFT